MPSQRSTKAGRPPQPKARCRFVPGGRDRGGPDRGNRYGVAVRAALITAITASCSRIHVPPSLIIRGSQPCRVLNGALKANAVPPTRTEARRDLPCSCQARPDGGAARGVHFRSDWWSVSSGDGPCRDGVGNDFFLSQTKVTVDRRGHELVHYPSRGRSSRSRRRAR